MSDGPKVTDILGVAAVGKAVEKVTGAVVDGAVGFLDRICSPVAGEFGLLLQDKVKRWRAQNAEAVVEKAAELVGDADVHAHPRLVHNILEMGSWTDDSTVQDMWSGLLASSCTADGEDDSNLLFTNVLSQVTKLEAKIVKHACEKASKYSSAAGLIFSFPLLTTVSELQQWTGESDLQRLDRECDHLRELGLIQGGLEQFSERIKVTPTPLALHLYVRCQGSRVAPVEYFGVGRGTADGAPLNATEET